MSAINTPFESKSLEEAAGRGFGRIQESALQFWKGVLSQPHLTLRQKHLVLLALHASPSSLNERAIKKQIDLALQAGATEGDIADVLLTIMPLANHPVYSGIPLLLQECEAAGEKDAKTLPEMPEQCAAIRQKFIEERGYWSPMRDTIAKLLPQYFEVFIETCMEPWRSGSLSPKEREFIYIAIDCSVSHTYEPGMKMHIQNALRFGATKEELLEVFSLAALMGLEGYFIGTSYLAQRPSQQNAF
ncbi:carboxymuconolactone decarboxylase family protein [Microvirga tunisiensis]|uniref:Carboxymuconolactone decarboxylase-like domain-containing protein n=1 Tax=Microvirga tunisiensis TaxID=2108360 RepID=A0A5N7MAN5_9HYPH|nr:carboxymuconolactone decarboxylase family protein [Microvirga tunisiensis]MPR05499.1 hypothetical protein [Microvirga tunisiensis]MPR23700.1 hypothetical protein [Microvirga tunisiensis]